jgi:hypothetical protein
MCTFCSFTASVEPYWEYKINFIPLYILSHSLPFLVNLFHKNWKTKIYIFTGSCPSDFSLSLRDHKTVPLFFLYVIFSVFPFDNMCIRCSYGQKRPHKNASQHCVFTVQYIILKQQAELYDCAVRRCRQKWKKGHGCPCLRVNLGVVWQSW